MKKIIFLVSFFTLFFVSCQKEETYSCDPTVDEWTKQNLEDIKHFNRFKISTFSLPYQQAIIRTFSPEKKKELWQEKVDYINSLSWTVEERKYIDFFSDSFKKMDYRKSDIKENDKLNDKLYLVLEEAIEKFKWDKMHAFELFFIVGDIDSYKFYPNTMKNNTKMKDCECRYDISCGFGNTCLSNLCKKTNDGCGVFGGAECTGTCTMGNNSDYR